MKVRTQAAISLALLLAACGPSPADVQRAQAADERARAWLAQIDSGDYGGSWETAARLFQVGISKEEWEARVWRVQGGLGKPMSRDLIAAKYSATWPSAPPGEHVYIQYRAQYNGRAIIESLTMRLDADEWKTIGYFIRPE
jgi:hypothetical protein